MWHVVTTAAHYLITATQHRPGRPPTHLCDIRNTLRHLGVRAVESIHHLLGHGTL